MLTTAELKVPVNSSTSSSVVGFFGLRDVRPLVVAVAFLGGMTLVMAVSDIRSSTSVSSTSVSWDPRVSLSLSEGWKDSSSDDSSPSSSDKGNHENMMRILHNSTINMVLTLKSPTSFSCSVDGLSSTDLL